MNDSEKRIFALELELLMYRVGGDALEALLRDNVIQMESHPVTIARKAVDEASRANARDLADGGPGEAA